MLLLGVLIVAALLPAMALTGHALQQSPGGGPWPPGVQKVPDDSPPLAPEDALRTFHMPPGYRVELVASEPLVQDPVAIDWDAAGRLWVVEMPGFMPDISATGEHAPVGRVVVLQDTNADGRMDARTIFAEGLVLARAIKVLESGVLVGEPPHVWLMRDTDGDLRMDVKTEVTAEYGRREVDPENNANGFDWALDNRMYTAGQAGIHLRYRNGAIETWPTLARGQWGVTHDDAGRVFRNMNESALHVDLVPTPYFARNPNLMRTRGSYERLATATNALNTVWPVRPNPGLNRGYQAGIRRADGTLERYTAVCTPLVYRGDRLPHELYGNIFVADPAANLVSRIVLEDDGTTLRARKAYPDAEFLASTDERFRPVYLSNAPDGTLYIVDLYRGLIEHRLSLTVYLREYSERRNLVQPTGLGRIYRVVHDDTRRDTSPVATGPPGDLVPMLAHASGWRRDDAQRRMVERGDRTVVPALQTLAANAADPRTRAHALWTLDGLDAIAPAHVVRALEDTSRDVRASALRLAERWLTLADHPLHTAVLARLDDGDWMVRHQLAASLGALPDGDARQTAVATLLERYGDDPITTDAALSGLRGSESAVLERLLRSGAGHTPQRAAAITMLAATVFHSAQESGAQQVLTWGAEDSRARWQREALMHGAEIAVLGAPVPGTLAALPNPALACPTCPGGRLSAGGAYVFPSPAVAIGAGAARPALRLTREPAAFVRLAATGGQLGRQAAAVLTHITWPGKPGDAAAPPRLTAEEQQRFDAGRDIYRTMCQACHLPDGRGQDRIAPSLIGSAALLADAGIPARILLNGKEGTTGLMPAIGAVLGDEQIASVLTYLRREWGHAATPVTPAAVSAVRAATAGRARPWTDAELRALRALPPPARR